MDWNGSDVLCVVAGGLARVQRHSRSADRAGAAAALERGAAAAPSSSSRVRPPPTSLLVFVLGLGTTLGTTSHLVDEQAVRLLLRERASERMDRSTSIDPDASDATSCHSLGTTTTTTTFNLVDEQARARGGLGRREPLLLH